MSGRRNDRDVNGRSRGRFRRFGPPVLLVLVYVALNTALTAYRWYPEHSFLHLLAPSLELAALWVVLLLLTRLDAAPRRIVLVLLAPLLTGLFLFSIGEAFTQFNFQNHFVPWTDLGYVPALVSMVFHSSGLARASVLVPLGVVLGLGLCALFYLILDAARARMAGAGAAVLLPLLIYLPLGAAVGYGPVLTQLVAAQLRPPDTPEMETPPAAAAVSENALHSDDTFPRLRDRSVFLIIVESYGHTLFSHPEHSDAMDGCYPEIERELRGAGYRMASHFLESPITGGRSWLAEATLLSGIRVGSQSAYDSIIESAPRNLTHDFFHAEHRSILAAPGTTTTDEQWKKFNRFDEYLVQSDFGYRGPHFAFGAMPDQFLLNYIRKNVLAGRSGNPHTGAPLFMQIMLVSSHTPFNMVPKYFEDWDAIGDGSEYRAAENPTFHNNWLTGGEYPEGFTASIRYVLRVVADFLIRTISDDSLIVIVGDHQPRFPVREKDSSSSVPIHILSRDETLVEPFMRYGFQPTLEPSQSLPHPGMEEFYPMFLRVIKGG